MLNKQRESACSGRHVQAPAGHAGAASAKVATHNRWRSSRGAVALSDTGYRDGAQGFRAVYPELPSLTPRPTGQHQEPRVNQEGTFTSGRTPADRSCALLNAMAATHCASKQVTELARLLSELGLQLILLLRVSGCFPLSVMISTMPALHASHWPHCTGVATNGVSRYGVRLMPQGGGCQQPYTLSNLGMSTLSFTLLAE